MPGRFEHLGLSIGKVSIRSPEKICSLIKIESLAAGVEC